MQADGWEFEFVKMRYHKEEQLDIGTEACYVKHCGSTRPAYVLAATKDSKTTDLMYVYEPMGLSRQYELQGSIRGRFQNLELALCFLQVASNEVGVKYMESACTVPMADEEAGLTEQENIREPWRSSKAIYVNGTIMVCHDRPSERHCTERLRHAHGVDECAKGKGVAYVSCAECSFANVIY